MTDCRTACQTGCSTGCWRSGCRKTDCPRTDCRKTGYPRTGASTISCWRSGCGTRIFRKRMFQMKSFQKRSFQRSWRNDSSRTADQKNGRRAASTDASAESACWRDGSGTGKGAHLQRRRRTDRWTRSSGSGSCPDAGRATDPGADAESSAVRDWTETTGCFHRTTRFPTFRCAPRLPPAPPESGKSGPACEVY